MDPIWLAIRPGAQSTRLLAMRGPMETILKAHLQRTPASPRAVVSLFEALALWEGARIRAALVVDDSCSDERTGLYRDTFAEFGETSPLYTLDWVPEAAGRRRRRDGLAGMGEFGDLERLLARSVAR